MARRLSILHTSLLILLLVVVFGVVFVARRKQVKPEPIEPIVRDEFIEELVAQTTQPYPLLLQGRTYYANGDLNRAKQLFKKATELDRNYRDAFYHLGITELALGDYDHAYYALLRAKVLDPLYKPTFEALVIVYREQGNATKAQQALQIAERL